MAQKSEKKPSFQLVFPEEKADCKTWVLFFCNPLLKETFVELLETVDGYRNQLQIQQFYYFHPRLQGNQQKNLVDNRPKEKIAQCPVFACNEITNYDQSVEKGHELSEKNKHMKPLSDPYKFHQNLVDTAVAIQFEQSKTRQWLENHLGLGIFPMEFVKSSINLDALHRNNLFEWERTLPYTDDDEDDDIQMKDKKLGVNSSSHKHFLLISFNANKSLSQILANSAYKPENDNQEQN